MAIKYVSFFVAVSTSLCLTFLATACSPSAPEAEQVETAKPEPPKPTSDFLVTSIPEGLKVYVARAPEKEEESQETEEIAPILVESSVKVKEEHFLINDKYYRGETPVMLTDLTSGEYLIGIAEVKLLDNARAWEVDITIDVVSYVPFHKTDDQKPTMTGAAVYSYELDANKPDSLIILAVPPNASLEELDTLYPSEKKFEYKMDPRTLQVILESEVGLPESVIEKAIELLGRGGKILLWGKGGAHAVSVDRNGVFRMESFVSPEDQ